jgi:hypothetical protein
MAGSEEERKTVPRNLSTMGFAVFIHIFFFRSETEMSNQPVLFRIDFSKKSCTDEERKISICES